MARHFSKNTNDRITLSAGALTTYGGNTTTVALWRGQLDTNDGTLVEARGDSGSMQLSSRPHHNTVVYVAYGGDWDYVEAQTYSDNVWRIDAWTKPSGLATIRAHASVLGGSWTHTNLSTQRGDSAQPITQVIAGSGTALGSINGDLAALMIIERVLTDGEIEALDGGLAAWLTAIGSTAAGLWAFNQTVITDPVLDITSGGANQVSISGTSITTDPPGWDYSVLTPVELVGTAVLGALTCNGAITKGTVLTGSAALGGLVATGALHAVANDVLLVDPDDWITPVYGALMDDLMSSGWFDSVNSGEPSTPPGFGLTAAVWPQSITPVPSLSGLATTSARVVFVVRMYHPAVSTNMDQMELPMVRAVSALMRRYHDDFDFGGVIRNVDLLGEAGAPLSANAGYLEYPDGALYRVYDVLVPCLILDIWPQGT